MSKCNCRFVLAGSDVSQPVSERGWESILLAADGRGRKCTINLRCDSGELPLLKCTGSEEGCSPLLLGRRDTPIAGLGRTKKPKRKRTKPPTAKQTAQQERFARAAASCKGKPGYRTCMSDKLGKK